MIRPRRRCAFTGTGVIANTERKRRRYLSRDELQQLLAALDAFATAGVR